MVVARHDEKFGNNTMFGVLACLRTGLWAMEHIGKKEQWNLVLTKEFSLKIEEELSKLCEFVGVSCPKFMIDKIVNQTHHTVHNS